MKTIITSLVMFICLLALNASATVHTVSNYLPVPAQYTTINAAITAASVGDTIYVHGSPTSYATTIITKRLVLIGAGYNPKNDFPYVSQVWTSINIYPAASGSTFFGMCCQGIAMMGGVAADTFMNLTFRGCQLYQGNFNIGNRNYSNILIENCIFMESYSVSALGGTVQFGLVIRNCIFSNYKVDVQSNTIVDHCIFIGSNTTFRAFQNCANSTFSNNIFHSRAINAADAVNCIFNNNLTYNCSNNTLPLAGMKSTPSLYIFAGVARFGSALMMSLSTRLA